MEVWEGYREDATLAGCDVIRGDVIPAGIFHIVSEVIVRHKDGDYLLMQRDYIKKKYPGLYEASASGCVLKGETPLEAAIRELREETGIIAEELKLINICSDLGTRGLYYIYFYETECDENSIIFQRGETISYIWLSKREFIKFVQLDKYIRDDRHRKSKYLNSLREISVNNIIGGIQNE